MNLRDIFLGLQGKMIGTLDAHRLATANKVAKGTASELQWREMLAKFLPERYSVTEGFVLDCARSSRSRPTSTPGTWPTPGRRRLRCAGCAGPAGDPSRRRPLQTESASADSRWGSGSRHPLESAPRPGLCGGVSAYGSGQDPDEQARNRTDGCCEDYASLWDGPRSLDGFLLREATHVLRD